MDMRFGILAAALWGAAAQAATVRASSEGTDPEGVRHPATLAFDGELQTAWAEGAEDDGVGSWIEVRFDKPTDVRSVSLWSGDLRKGERSARESARPKLVTITLETDAGPVTVQEAVPDTREEIRRRDIAIVGTARSIRISIDEVFPGFLENDCYLAEVAVNFTEPPTGPVEALRTWQASDVGLKAAEKHREAVIALFDRVDQNELGDTEAFQQLMDWTANGAPWVQDKARRDVPYGFRVQAIPPDEVAVEALLKLKDVNAVPALEMGVARLSGKEQKSLRGKVEYMEAFAELQTRRRNLPVWGVEGWEKGALRGLGEPLAIAQGAFGDVYVADVANHRVTVFGPDGTTRATWGAGKPSVADAWMGGKRSWYAAGAEPSEAEGGLVNPIDVAITPIKNGELVAVLDATGRVQWFNDQGAVVRTVKAAPSSKPGARRGGVGHLVLLGAKTAVVWGDEVVVVDEAGEEVRWTISDGAPITAEPLKGGKLLLGFREGGVMYSADGFRHGVILPESAMPKGIEAYDLTTDEKGKLWLIGDNGVAVKYKRPGKIDWQVRWSEASVDYPRAAVRDGMLFISGEDRVRRIDALELHAKEELEE